MSEDYVFQGFEPANTTPVPDILFDQLLTELGCAELKVLLYIIRRTWGFKKNSDAISFNQFLKGIVTKDKRVLDKGCGVKNRTVLSTALADLERKGYIASSKGIDPHGDKATTLYNIKFKSQEVVSNPYHVAIGGGIKPVPPVVSETYHRSTETVPGVVSNPYLQETVIQQTDSQETVIQKDTSHDGASAPHDDASLSSENASQEITPPESGENEKTPEQPHGETTAIPASNATVTTSTPDVKPSVNAVSQNTQGAMGVSTSPQGTPQKQTSVQSPIASDTHTRTTYTKRNGKILIDEWYAMFEELYRALPGYAPNFRIPQDANSTSAILSMINSGATREQAAFVFKDICNETDPFWHTKRTITCVKSQFATRVSKMKVKPRGSKVSIQQQLQDEVPDFTVREQWELLNMMPDERKAYSQQLTAHLKAQREQEARVQSEQRVAQQASA